jgi:hypothetical protein
LRGRTSLALLATGCAAAIGIPGCGGSEASSTTASRAQRIEAQDAKAKEETRTAETAVEVYATDHNRSYAGADTHDLEAIEPELRGVPLDVSSNAKTYGVAVTSASGTVFALARTAGGAIQFKCNAPGRGECPPSGDWSR